MILDSQRSAMWSLAAIVASCLLQCAAGASSEESWSFLKMKSQAQEQTIGLSSATVTARKNLGAARTLLQSASATGRFTSITIPLDICGSYTSLSKQAIQSAVKNDPRSLQSYFRQCSFGALNLDDNSGSNLVLTQKVPIRKNCGGCNIDGIGQEAEDWIQQNLNIDLNKYSVRIFVFPEGSCGWAGMARQGCFDANPGAGTNGRICRAWLTAFQGRALMHEVGHNLGLGHANRGGAEAGDCSSPMSNCGGYFCPNGYHGMMLGWYSPIATIDINSIPSDTWINKRLPPRVASSTNYVKLTGSGLDAYCTYSVAVGWENEPSEFSGQVLCHSPLSNSDWSRSNIVAQLGAGQSDSIGGFVVRNAPGASLAGATFQVCRGRCDPSAASDNGSAGAGRGGKKSPPPKEKSKHSPPPKKKSHKKRPPPPKKSHKKRSPPPKKGSKRG